MTQQLRAEQNVSLRVVLYENETLRLPKRSRGIVVREGTVWMTKDGKDDVLYAGDQVLFGSSRWAAVVSPATSRVVIEVLGGESPRSAAMTPAPDFGRLSQRSLG